MIVHVQWELAKELIVRAEMGRKIDAVRRIRTPQTLRLVTAKEVVDALTNGDFTMDQPRGMGPATAIVEVPDDRITLTVNNCPEINQ